MTLITDHVWRPPGGIRKDAEQAVCGYMNCGRPRSEHERAVSGTLLGRKMPRLKARATA